MHETQTSTKAGRAAKRISRAGGRMMCGEAGINGVSERDKEQNTQYKKDIPSIMATRTSQGAVYAQH